MTDRRLRFKGNTKLYGLQPESLHGIDTCLGVFHSRGLPMTITSARGDQHGPHSHHFKGLAWDIRIWDIAGEEQLVCEELQDALGDQYQVILETDHIHVEYDPVDGGIL